MEHRLNARELRRVSAHALHQHHFAQHCARARRHCCHRGRREPILCKQAGKKLDRRARAPRRKQQAARDLLAHQRHLQRAGFGLLEHGRDAGLAVVCDPVQLFREKPESDQHASVRQRVADAYFRDNAGETQLRQLGAVGRKRAHLSAKVCSDYGRLPRVGLKSGHESCHRHSRAGTIASENLPIALSGRLYLKKTPSFLSCLCTCCR